MSGRGLCWVAVRRRRWRISLSGGLFWRIFFGWRTSSFFSFLFNGSLFLKSSSFRSLGSSCHCSLFFFRCLSWRIFLRSFRFGRGFCLFRASGFRSLRFLRFLSSWKGFRVLLLWGVRWSSFCLLLRFLSRLGIVVISFFGLLLRIPCLLLAVVLVIIEVDISWDWFALRP